jgi:hypothetical protein
MMPAGAILVVFRKIRPIFPGQKNNSKSFTAPHSRATFGKKCIKDGKIL